MAKRQNKKRLPKQQAGKSNLLGCAVVLFILLVVGGMISGLLDTINPSRVESRNGTRTAAWIAQVIVSTKRANEFDSTAAARSTNQALTPTRTPWPTQTRTRIPSPTPTRTPAARSYELRDDCGQIPVQECAGKDCEIVMWLDSGMSVNILYEAGHRLKYLIKSYADGNVWYTWVQPDQSFLYIHEDFIDTGVQNSCPKYYTR